MDILSFTIISLLLKFVLGQELHPWGPHYGGWDYDDIETCREQEKLSSWWDTRNGSKYLVKKISEENWWRGSVNSMYDYHKMFCMESGLVLPTTHNIEDWNTLRLIAIETYKHMVFAEIDKVLDPIYFERSMMQMFLLDMKYNADPKKGKLGAMSLENPADPDIFIVWGDNSPANIDEHVRVGMTVSRYEDGTVWHGISAESWPPNLSGGHIWSNGWFPILCMFPEDSKCYKLSLEEQLIKNHPFHDTLFYLTDAFRGQFYMSSYMKPRQEGEKLCKQNGYTLLDKALEELPWTTDYLRWDVDRLREAYSNALRHNLDNTFPYAGFHARPGHEYYFNFTRSKLLGDRILVYSNDQPYKEWQLIERSLGENADRFCLCYKAS